MQYQEYLSYLRYHYSTSTSWYHQSSTLGLGLGRGTSMASSSLPNPTPWGTTDIRSWCLNEKVVSCRGKGTPCNHAFPRQLTTFSFKHQLLSSGYRLLVVSRARHRNPRTNVGTWRASAQDTILTPISWTLLEWWFHVNGCLNDGYSPFKHHLHVTINRAVCPG